MKSEEFKQRMEDAKTAKSCLDWHKHCKAECCKAVFINIPSEVLEEKGTYINIHNKIDFNERWYYRLRGVQYIHGEGLTGKYASIPTTSTRSKIHTVL